MYGRAFFTLSLLVVAAVMAEGCASDDDQDVAQNEVRQVPKSECTVFHFEATPAHGFPLSGNAADIEFLSLSGALLAGTIDYKSIAKLGQHELRSLTMAFEIVNDMTQRIHGQMELAATTPQRCVDQPPKAKDAEGFPLETHPRRPFTNAIDYHYKPYTGTEGFPHDVDTYANLCLDTSDWIKTGIRSFSLKHAHHLNAKYGSQGASTADTIEVYEEETFSLRWLDANSHWSSNTWLSGSLGADKRFADQTSLDYEGDYSFDGLFVSRRITDTRKISSFMRSHVSFPKGRTESNVVQWDALACGELSRVEYVLALLLRDFGAHARRIVSN